MAEARIYSSKDKDEVEVELRFSELNQVVLSRGDFIYREYFSKALRAGVMTNAEAIKILKDREIWGDEQESHVVDIQIKLIGLEGEIKGCKKKDAVSLTLFDKIKRLRRELTETNNIRSNVLDNTSESMASEMRTQFFAAECAVYNTTGQKVFKDLKDFLARLDENIATDSYRQALIINYEKALGITLPDNLEESSLVEDKWLNDIKAVEEEAAKPKPKKKVTKKRKSRKKKTPVSTTK